MDQNPRKDKAKKLQQKASAFANQKQLRAGSDPNYPVEELAGDESTDNRIDINDAENNAEYRMTTPAGGPFMHPMHDDTADPQLDHPQPENKTKKEQSRR